MSAIILHLSDIHIRSNHDWILAKPTEIAATLNGSLPDSSAVFIVVSGDIAFSGKREQYEAAKGLLFAIRDAILSEKEIPIHFITAPGNHDCDFSKGTRARTLALNAVRMDASQLEDSIVEIGTITQDSYRAFESQIKSKNETTLGDTLWMTHRFTVEGKEVVFDTINVSWCSNLHEEPGSLIFPVDRYQHHLNEISDLRIAVLHHPLNWFNQSSYHPFRRLVRGVADIVISGHEHVGGVGEDLHSESGHSAYIEGCVLQSDNAALDSSFNVAVLNLDDGTYLSTRYQWTQAGYYAASEEGSWEGFRRLPEKSHNVFTLTRDFEQQLSDPGGVFKSNTRTARLADLYVYPDMQEMLERAELRKIINTNTLLSFDQLEGGLLLIGEENVGATSLLYMLFRAYHERGFVPLYLRGVDIKGVASRDIDVAIKNAAAEQYGAHCVENYLQCPSRKKLLLLDDFDDGPVKSSHLRAGQLTAFAARYSHMIITASELFDFDSSVRPHVRDTLSALKNYSLLPMGYVLRAQLVRRWFNMTAGDGSLDDAAFLARCDQGEKLLDSVMARNIVPALPLYLLTLLQTLEAGSAGDFDESGLGEYYEFLFREGLRAAAVPKTKWGQVIEYCSHLAWHMHASEHKELSMQEMREFNDSYSTKEVTVDLDSRVRELVRASVLSQTGDYVRFRYHYIYYFLKGRYIDFQLRLHNQDVASHVRECCAHLYVRENANTILFLAHHAFKNPDFLNLVVDALSKPFSFFEPIAFNGKDTVAISDFVRELPKLTYSGESPEDARQRLLERKDELRDKPDGLQEQKQDGADSDFIAQMVALLKSVEILGQILKNQAAGISRKQRVELLQLVMQGPLRAIRAYFELFMADKERAVNDLADFLAKRKIHEGDLEKRRGIARSFFAHLIQMASFGFIAKAVSSISSDVLQEDIDSAAGVLNTPAARLIAIGTKLDSPKALPKPDLKALIEESKSDFVAFRVLQFLILQHLYMFKTDERDKQWLASVKVIDIRTQHAIEFRTQRTKERS